MRPDDTQEMTRVLRILARAERLMQSGATLDEALVKIEISREKFECSLDQYALPPNALEGLSSSTLFDAVVPVFHDDAAGETEHIGSGIVFDVGGELFLLSAAHVFDSGEKGTVKVDLREQVREVPHQTSITKDNAPISIDFLWYYKVLDPAESVLQVGNFEVGGGRYRRDDPARGHRWYPAR